MYIDSDWRLRDKRTMQLNGNSSDKIMQMIPVSNFPSRLSWSTLGNSKQKYDWQSDKMI